MTLRSICLLLPGVLLVAACAPTAPPVFEDPRPKGLFATPEQLAFTCVTPGCDSSQKVMIEVVGNRRVAVKRVLIEGTSTEDFSFTSSEAAPFVVGANSSFEIDVRYIPTGAPAAGAVKLLVTYTDASPEESPDRLPPGELAIPLVRRLVGEPLIKVTPEQLSFGVVQPGTEATLSLRIGNEGFGNVAAEVASIESEHVDLNVALPADLTIAPGAGLDVPVTFAPGSEGYLQSELVVTTTSSDLVPTVVRVQGTSLTLPRLAIEPATRIDFGEVAKGKQRGMTVHLMNQGGTELVIADVTVAESTGNLKVQVPNDGTALRLAPLERMPLPISLEGNTAGEIDGRVRVASNDPAQAVFELQILGTVTEPRLTLDPTVIDFGTAPVGWVLKRPVELRNTGHGPLTVKNIQMVGGSSSLFTLGQLPALPRVLQRDQRIAVDVEFRAEAGASFSGWISVETDDPQTPFSEIELKAKAGSCQEGCPIANGTPSCSVGRCEVGACNAGYFDTDGAAATGCECREIGTDPGSFCTDGRYVGVLNDNDGDQASVTGVLPTGNDVDVIRFFAEDAFAAFSENFDVKVRLASSDPSIRLCVYRYPTGTHENDCYWINESCPSDRNFRQDGNNVSGDDADFVVKVFRDPNAAPTCASYTVFMSNGL
ncbi:MAG: choice-of-anchor D domain-containing protein [Myxococcaceae bacterium]